MKKQWVMQGIVSVAVVLLTAGVGLAMDDRLSAETKECLGCHSEMRGIVSQWEDSAHWNAGVGCYECHKAEKSTTNGAYMTSLSVTIEILDLILRK